MPANTNPIFVLTPDRGINGGGRITGVNTSRDLSTSTANAVNIFSAGTNGSRVDSIDIMVASTGQTTSSTASIVRIFQCTDGSYSNPRLLREEAVGVKTINATTGAAAVNTISFTTPIVLPSGYYLVATMSSTPGTGLFMDVTVYGGDY